MLHHHPSSPAMPQAGRSQLFPSAPLLCLVKKMKTEDPRVNRSFLLGPVVNLVTHMNSAPRDLIAGILGKSAGTSRQKCFPFSFLELLFHLNV
jgi:hypothetical protein